jgi:integrase
MNRRRKTHRGLPRRVQAKHGAYYFFAPAPTRNPYTGKFQTWIRLCSIADGEPIMYSKLGELMRDKKLVDGTMPSLCADWKDRKLDRYSEEVQKEYRRMADVIATAFEDYTVADVTTKDCADFLRDNFRSKHNTAQKYANVLRKIFKFAISERGFRQDNPCDQLDLSDYQTKRREVLPAHQAIKAIREAALIGKDGLPTESGPMFQCIVDMSYLVWQRAIDIRMLLETQIGANTIRFKPSKTAGTSGKVLDVEITPQIRAVIERAKAIKKKYRIISPYLFPTQKGGAYSKTGLHSMWRRAKERANVTDGIQFKDLRALGATDAAKAGKDRAEIQTRLAHTTGKTTEIYIKEAIPEKSGLDLKLPW